MLRYLLLNLVFALAVFLVIALLKPRLVYKRLLSVLMVMLLLTLIFDSLIIGLDMVRYNNSYLSGIILIKAPLEDFFYTVVATLLTITIWERLSE